jgi:hypothetical protein
VTRLLYVLAPAPQGRASGLHVQLPARAKGARAALVLSKLRARGPTALGRIGELTAGQAQSRTVIGHSRPGRNQRP